MTWESKILRIDVPYKSQVDDYKTNPRAARSEEELNELGKAGWEPISAWSEDPWGSFILLRRSK
jgi:hypothetical protein